MRLLIDVGTGFKPVPATAGDSRKISVGTEYYSVPNIENEAKTLLNYFFIGLTLPNDAFWVNLRPDSPDNIIDPLLAQTDVGKILLEADLQLKKDTAKYTSPDTPEGRVYWDKLYEKAGEIFGSENITIPTLTRPWIVPDEIIIREAEDNAYIYKATLKVMLEEDYLNQVKGQGSKVEGTAVGANEPSPLRAQYQFKDPRLKELNVYSSQLIRELIIPKLTQEINTSRRYAPLRQVYYSLILAQWFKTQMARRGGFQTRPYIATLIDSKDLTGLASKKPYSTDAYFTAYQKSFKDGEYNIKEPRYTPYGQTIRSYFSGGASLVTITPTSTIIGEGSITNNPQYTFYAETNSVESGKAFPPSLRIARDHPEFGSFDDFSEDPRSNRAAMSGARADVRYNKMPDDRRKDIAEKPVKISELPERLLRIVVGPASFGHSPDKATDILTAMTMLHSNSSFVYSAVVGNQILVDYHEGIKSFYDKFSKAGHILNPLYMKALIGVKEGLAESEILLW